MEKECEFYDEEVKPYRKTDDKPIIYIFKCIGLSLLLSDFSILAVRYTIVINQHLSSHITWYII